MGHEQREEEDVRAMMWRVMALHLEQADTGRDTRNKGLSEKLDLGISPAPGVDECGWGARCKSAGGSARVR